METAFRIEKNGLPSFYQRMEKVIIQKFFYTVKIKRLKKDIPVFLTKSKPTRQHFTDEVRILIIRFGAAWIVLKL